MRFFGSILHPKDLTTKEYVDKAADNLDKKIEKLDEDKADKETIVEYSAEEVISLWNKYKK